MFFLFFCSFECSFVNLVTQIIQVLRCPSKSKSTRFHCAHLAVTCQHPVCPSPSARERRGKFALDASLRQSRQLLAQSLMMSSQHASSPSDRVPLLHPSVNICLLLATAVQCNWLWRSKRGKMMLHIVMPHLFDIQSKVLALFWIWFAFTIYHSYMSARVNTLKFWLLVNLQ